MITRDELKAAVLNYSKALATNESFEKRLECVDILTAKIDQLFTELAQLRGRKPEYYETLVGSFIREPNDRANWETATVGSEFQLRPIMFPETYIVALKDGKKVAMLKEADNAAEAEAHNEAGEC